MMVATVPIITPIMVKVGVDPVWFGVLIVILIETAMITPPVGLNLYVVQGWRKSGRSNDVIIGALPFVLTMFAMLAIISFWPNLVLWLPQVFTIATGRTHPALADLIFTGKQTSVKP